jgi:hypothetical protein
MESGTNPDLEATGPGSLAHRALDAQGRLDRGAGALEDGEELVCAGVDLMATGPDHGVPDDAAHIVQQAAIAGTQSIQNRGRALDVGQQEGDRAGGQRRSPTGRRVPTLGFQLAVDEADWQDPVLPGGVQQAFASPLPGGVVLEVDLLESGQRVSNMRRVVDGQPAPAARVDVGECPVREAGAVPGFQLAH